MPKIDSPLDEYRRLTYNRTIEKLRQAQESKGTPLQKLLAAKTDIQSTKP